MKKDSLIYAELDALTEAAMKQTIRQTLLENSVMDSDVKLNGISVLENATFTQEQTLDFMKQTIKPIMEASGLTNLDKMTFNPNKKNVRSVMLPVYEVALTLEAARLGQLSEDSLDSVFVPNTIEELPGDVEGPEDVTNDELNAPLDSIVKNNVSESDCGCEGSPAELVDVNQFEDNEYPNGPDDNISDTAKNVVEFITDRFGRKIMVENDEEFSKGESIETKEYADPDPVDPNFKSSADIEPYDPGKPAVGADKGLFAPYTEAKSISAYIKYLLKEEDLDLLNTTNEEEVDQKSDTSLKTYSGDQAGIPGSISDNQLDGKEPGDEVVQEQQAFLAKAILGRIFHEYGIKHPVMKRSIVCEAVHYLTKYGIKSLYPSIPDMADLVVAQNKISESGVGYSPNVINESTNYSYLNEVLSDKQNRRFESLTKSKGIKKGGKKVEGGAEGVKHNPIKKALRSTNESANQLAEAARLLAESVERDRQIFRSKLSAFNPEAKQLVASKWSFRESALSQNAVDLIDLLTVRRYVCEGADLRDFLSAIGKDSPVLRRSFFRENGSSNDDLVTAVLMTEVVSSAKRIDTPCKGLNESESAKCRKETKKYVIENTIAHINLCDGMANPENAMSKIKEVAHKFNRGVIL